MIVQKKTGSLGCRLRWPTCLGRNGVIFMMLKKGLRKEQSFKNWINHLKEWEVVVDDGE